MDKRFFYQLCAAGLCLGGSCVWLYYHYGIAAVFSVLIMTAGALWWYSEDIIAAENLEEEAKVTATYRGKGVVD